MFCLEMRTFYFYTATPEELVLLASNKKPVIKPSLKKKRDEDFLGAKTLLPQKLLLTGNSFLEVNFKLKVENFLLITGSQ